MEDKTNMENIFDIIENTGIVPVIKLDKHEDAVPLCEALQKGGIPIAEITFRTDAAEKSISLVAQNTKNILVGAGTVTTKEQADRAIGAGAKFIVSPGFNPKIVEYVLKKNVPIVPGCITPSEIEMALEFSLNVLKFFPAEQSGGLSKIKALCAPYTNIRFIPTGGIDLKNITEYLSFDKVVACGGSFMVKDEYIKQGEFDKIERLAKESVSTVLGFEISHIDMASIDNTEEKIKYLSNMLLMPINESDTSYKIGNMFEINKNAKDKKSSLYIKTNSVDRAIYQMKRQGIKFDETKKVVSKNKKTVSICIDNAGFDFDICLIKK